MSDDELDALFGALDGNEEQGPIRSSQIPNDICNSLVEEQNVELHHSSTKTNMGQNITAIRVRETKKGSAAEKIKNEHTATEPTQPKDEEQRAIATGTSHDKTIRTYTAYPDPTYADQKTDTLIHDSKPAKTYPFTLDPFQTTAISCIQRNESVLVAAHTSAGKTVVAEYAIAQSLREGQRVIYTSPIKALSNQKYRDLQEEFENVGLMTGDITINPTATCLVMTTEILRSMLYRGSEIMREVAWVIYDEVHYMRDKERGVVWEESIILLPHKVRFVFLSATIPNAQQFVHWIAKIHHQTCHVVYTNYRPVPLQHYIFAHGGDGLHLVVDERGRFREANFQKAMASLTSQGGGGENGGGGGDGGENTGNEGRNNAAGKKRKRQGSKGAAANPDLYRIVKLVMERNLDPVIVFSFSKKDCETYALELNREDFTEDLEKDLISQVYKNAIESLSEDDRKLPQVEALLPLLKKGIGIHHGGLLPILKEIVEILFSEGLIKILFATETFAIGINMPAKTVIFTNTRKWDGRDFRWLTSGEYIQMSGRAGRRGKDDRGIVIQMVDEKMEPSVCKGILYGDPDPLNSSYRISYNMLVNMLRVGDDVDPEYLLRSSFYQFQQASLAPGLDEQAGVLETEANAVVIGEGGEMDEEAVREYYQLNQQLHLTELKLKNIERKPLHMGPFLQSSGRLLKCVIDGDRYGWGVLISYRRKQGLGSGGTAGLQASQSVKPVHTLDVLLNCVDKQFDEVKSGKPSEDSLLWRGSSQHCRPVNEGSDPEEKISMRVFTMHLNDIEDISAVRIFVPKDCHPDTARKSVGKSLKEVIRRFPDGLPLLDPFTDMKISSEEYTTALDRKKTLQERLATHSLSSSMASEEREKRVLSYAKKIELIESAKLLRQESLASQNIVMRDDLKKMKRVLRHLGYMDTSGVISTKGRTACEINTANELVVVELVFSGVFNDLSVEQTASLLSCLTFDEKLKDDCGDPAKGLKSLLAAPFYKLQETARIVAKAQLSCNIEVDEDEFVNQFNPGLMEAVFAWCKGMKFVEVQKLTGTFEGTTIRTLRRLEELIRQLSTAAKAIGNHELQLKFENGGDLIKRDIVFCSSLYL